MPPGKLLGVNAKNITKRIGACSGEDKFGTANGNRTRILALKGLRANRCTIAALVGERQSNYYTRNGLFPLRGEKHQQEVTSHQPALSLPNGSLLAVFPLLVPCRLNRFQFAL